MVPSWAVPPLVAIGLSQVAVIATSIYLHRALAHRSLRVHPVADVIFRAILWLATGQDRQEWVAVHRKHHKHTDKEGDPHSPVLRGYWKVWLLNAYYYWLEARRSETLAKFAPDLAPDLLDRVLFSRGLLGIAVGISGLCFFMGFWAGILAGALHGVLYTMVLAPMINARGHDHGQQNFMNTAYNSRLWAWVTGGESLHNNHHAYKRSPKFSVRRSEFDPSWTIIRALAAAGLLVILGPLGIRPAALRQRRLT